MDSRGKSHVLVVDDEPDTCTVLDEALSLRGFAVRTATSGQAALSILERAKVDVVLTDVSMQGMSGLELCRSVKELAPDLPVVVLTGFSNIATAIEAIRSSAYDFLCKPIELDAVISTLQRAVEQRSLRREVRGMRRSLERHHGFGELIGASPSMRQILGLLPRIADSEANVLITGESGTGKELVAHAIHNASSRSAGPFVAINCAAVPEALLESDLFGHEKGAFTDARTSRDGLFVEADGGTLFLDEIGELPLALQPKLLRVLQERKVRPLGTHSETPFDARLICATNRDLDSAVGQRTFRQDLYFRVNVVQIELPPLRERGADVLLLAQRFIEELSARAQRTAPSISPEVADRLLNYPWPGNVRELRNCIERAMALSQADCLTTRDLPDRIVDFRPSSPVLAVMEDPKELFTLEEMERRYIQKVIDALGSKTLAARTLGIDRATLYRKLERLRKGPP